MCEEAGSKFVCQGSEIFFGVWDSMLDLPLGLLYPADPGLPKLDHQCKHSSIGHVLGTGFSLTQATSQVPGKYVGLRESAINSNLCKIVPTTVTNLVVEFNASKRGVGETLLADVAFASSTSERRRAQANARCRVWGSGPGGSVTWRYLLLSSLLAVRLPQLLILARLVLSLRVHAVSVAIAQSSFICTLQP